MRERTGEICMLDFWPAAGGQEWEGYAAWNPPILPLLLNGTSDRVQMSPKVRSLLLLPYHMEASSLSPAELLCPGEAASQPGPQVVHPASFSLVPFWPSEAVLLHVFPTGSAHSPTSPSQLAFCFLPSFLRVPLAAVGRKEPPFAGCWN